MFQEEDRYNYERKLSNLKQENFYNISEYQQEVEKIFDFYCFSSRLDRRHESKRLDEFLMKELHHETLLELSKHGIFKSHEALKHIAGVEEIARQQAVLNSKTLNPVYQDSNSNSDPKKEYVKRKYCARHGQGFHSTEECNTAKAELKKSTRKMNKPSSSYINIIKAPRPKLSGLVFEGTSNNGDLLFQLDPGANLSCISTEVANRMNLSNKIIKREESIQVATGEIVKSVGSLDFVFSLKKIPGVLFKNSFTVLPGKLEFVLLGEDFLINQEVRIDYKEASVVIADRIIFLDPLAKEFNESQDAELISKAMLISKNVLKDEEKQLINKFEK